MNFAIIGCGVIAETHAKALRALEAEGCHLRAVCDVVPEKADALFGKGASPRFARLPEPRNHPPVSLCQNTWNPPISSSPLAAICKQRRIKTTLPTISR